MLSRILPAVTKSLVQQGLEAKALEAICRVNPDDLYMAIRENLQLLQLVKPADMEKYRRMAYSTGAWASQILDTRYILARVKPRRPELVGVILNTPGGMEWLDSQVEQARKELLGHG